MGIAFRRTDAPPQCGPRLCPPSKSDEDEVLVLICTPILFEQSPPNQHDRITAAGLRTRSEGAAIAQASAVNERRVAEGTFAVLRSRLARRLPPSSSQASSVTEANVP